MSGLLMPLLLLAILAAATGLLVLGGFWRALVAFFNVLLAASIATAWYPVLADLLEGQLPAYRYLVDFVSVWLIFAGVASLTRTMTDWLAPNKVAFPPLVERIGCGIASFLTAWVLMAFTAASLHTAPVTRDFIQPTPEARMLSILSPDRAWLGWVRNSSLSGPFSRGEPYVFDRDGDFILRYADRRRKLELEEGLVIPVE